MDSWQLFYLTGIVMGTGAIAGPSNGATLVLFMASILQFAIAIALKAMS